MLFGLELPGHWPDPTKDINNLFPELIECVKLSDQIGVDAFIMGEHHFMDYNATPDPIALACYLAPITSNQKLILSVLCLPWHEIEMLAGRIAQADQLTRGRLELGLARGGSTYEPSKMFMDLDPEANLEKFNEQLEALKRLFTEKDISFDGKYTKFRDVTIVPPVYQRPYPPIWQASMRPESAFHIAKNGYHVQTSQLRQPMSFVQEVMDSFRAGVKESSQPQGKQKISMLHWVYIAKDEDDRREKVEMAYQKHRKFMGLLQNTSNVKEGVVHGVDVEGPAEDYAETLLSGAKDYVLERIMEFKEMGFDEFGMKLHIGPDHKDIMESLETFGDYVLPKVQTKHSAAAE